MNHRPTISEYVRDILWNRLRLTSMRNVVRVLRSRLGITPMHKVVTELTRRNVGLRDREALEVFGGYGDFHTRDYASRVKHLTVWELRPECEEALRSRFPDARVLITDTYCEIKRTTSKFGLIIVDNPACAFGGHCEHFDLLPDLFKVASDDCIMILNVLPRTKNHENLSENQLAKRSQFYITSAPENVEFGNMVQVYAQHCVQNHFALEWHFFQRRGLVWYMVLKLMKSNCDKNGHNASI